MTARSVVRVVFSAKLGWWPRLSPALGLLIMVTVDGPWWLLLTWVAMWWFSEQLNLNTAWLRGCTAGFEQFDQISRDANMTMNMGDLMDLCDEHGVPLEKVARLVWGDDE